MFRSIFSCFLMLFLINSVNAMEDPDKGKSEQLMVEENLLTKEEAMHIAKRIYDKVWWEKGTENRIFTLNAAIHNIFTQYADGNVSAILSALTETAIGNIGGYSGGLTSLAHGTLTGGSTTSDNLIIAHYIKDLMEKVRHPLPESCQTWQYTSGSYGIPSKSGISCSSYLNRHPVNETQKYQESLDSLVKDYRHLLEQREHNLVSMGESGFSMVPSGQEGYHYLDLGTILEEGFDGIKKLGTFYGALAKKQGGDALNRYAQEINNYNAVDPHNIMITQDGTALVMMENNKFSIVFGGMGVGVGGMEKGKELANEFNNPPLNFQSGLGGAHQGFYKRLMASWDEIYRFCKLHADQTHRPLKDFKFEIIGHSMGGGVAPIAALRLAMFVFDGKPDNHIEVITFGAPRVLDATLANTYNSILEDKTLMFVHEGDDYVPNQPPVMIGYLHVGKRIMIPEPRVDPDPRKNRRVFHQYAGYKNVLANCKIELDTQHTSCASVAREKSDIAYYGQTAKNALLMPGRALYNHLFGDKQDFIEHRLQ